MTLQQAAQQALDIQDGCNASGIASAMVRTMMDVLWPIARETGKGTDWVNQHPIVTMFLDKLADLNGRADFDQAYDAVYDLANGTSEGISKLAADRAIGATEAVTEV